MDPVVIESINDQLWTPFEKAFAENDADTFFGLHTNDVVRVNRTSKSVRHGDEYQNTSGENMRRRAEEGRFSILTLRFTERIHSEDAAWETGVYRFESTSNGTVNFGEFYVVLQKVDGKWRVAVDADGPSTQAAYESAREMSETDW